MYGFIKQLLKAKVPPQVGGSPAIPQNTLYVKNWVSLKYLFINLSLYKSHAAFGVYTTLIRQNSDGQVWVCTFVVVAF